jgi:hypothetical protein
MAARTLLPQEDFSALALAVSSFNAYSQMLDDDSYSFMPVERAGSGDSQKGAMDNEEGEIYQAVNFIPAEVYELIRTWELSYYKRQEILDSMDTESFPNAAESVFEPTRCMLGPMAPPKRFYRTFWRALTLRAVQRGKEIAFDRAGMSSSDASADGTRTSRESY